MSMLMAKDFRRLPIGAKNPVDVPEGYLGNETATKRWMRSEGTRLNFYLVSRKGFTETSKSDDQFHSTVSSDNNVSNPQRTLTFSTRAELQTGKSYYFLWEGDKKKLFGLGPAVVYVAPLFSPLAPSQSNTSVSQTVSNRSVCFPHVLFFSLKLQNFDIASPR